MHAPRRDQSIGIFDSGVGGLTVMNQIAKALPNEKLLYLGDTARVPYGEKSPETIIRFTIENAIFLMEQNIKMLVIACNTATAFAISKIQSIFNLPVIGVIEPGAEQAVKMTKNNHIAVLGTKATILSKAYDNKILSLNPDAKIFAQACPLFVPLIEEGLYQHAATTLIVNEYLGPLREKNIDTVLLGCTHYPLLKEAIQNYLGDEVAIVDSASTCAEKVKESLKKYQLETEASSPTPHQFFVTDNMDKFQMIGRTFFTGTIDNISLINNLRFEHNL